MPCCGCCGHGFCFGHLMYIFEKIAAFCAMTAIISCIIVTVIVSIGIGVGIGYNYCFVDTKTLRLPEGVSDNSHNKRFPKGPYVYPLSGESSNETEVTTINANTFIHHTRPDSTPSFPSLPNISNIPEKVDEDPRFPPPSYYPGGQGSISGIDSALKSDSEIPHFPGGHGIVPGGSDSDGSGSISHISRPPSDSEHKNSQVISGGHTPSPSIPGSDGGSKSDSEIPHFPGGHGIIPGGSDSDGSGTISHISRPPSDSEHKNSQVISGGHTPSPSIPGSVGGPKSDSEIPHFPGGHGNIPAGSDSDGSGTISYITRPPSDSEHKNSQVISGSHTPSPDPYGPPKEHEYDHSDPLLPDTPNVSNEQESISGIPGNTESEKPQFNLPNDQGPPSNSENQGGIPDDIYIYSDNQDFSHSITQGQESITDFPQSPKFPGSFRKIQTFNSKAKLAPSMPRPAERTNIKRLKVVPLTGSRRQQFDEIRKGVKANAKYIDKSFGASDYEDSDITKGEEYDQTRSKEKYRRRKPVQRRKYNKFPTTTTFMPTIVIPLKKYANISPLISKILAQNKNVTLQFITL